MDNVDISRIRHNLSSYGHLYDQDYDFSELEGVQVSTIIQDVNELLEEDILNLFEFYHDTPVHIAIAYCLSQFSRMSNKERIEMFNMLMNLLSLLKEDKQNNVQALQLATIYCYCYLSSGESLAHTTLAAGSETVLKSAKKSRKTGVQSQGQSQLSSWNWDEQKVCMVETVFLLIQQSSIHLLTSAATTASMLWDIVKCLIKFEPNIKSTEIKKIIGSLVAFIVDRFGQSNQVVDVIMENLQLSTHLSEFMADLLIAMVDSCNSAYKVYEKLCLEFSQLNLEAEDKSAKEYAKFFGRLVLHEGSVEMLRGHIGHLQTQIDSDSYVIRCSVIEILGQMLSIIPNQPSDTYTDDCMRISLLLEQRLHDTSSYCRAKVLKTFALLCHVADGNSFRNCIPLPRRKFVVDLAIGRLVDKSSIVRKEAIRFIACAIKYHPFWLDGGGIDVQLFKQKYEHFNEQLQKVSELRKDESGAQDIIAELEDALPQSAKELLAEDRRKSVIGGEGADQPIYSEEEITQLQVQRKYYEDAVDFALQVQQSLEIVSSLLHSKVKSDVVESIHCIVDAARVDIKEAVLSVKKVLYLVWSKDTGDMESRSIREHVLQAFHSLYLDLDVDDPVQMELGIESLLHLTKNMSFADRESLVEILAALKEKQLIPAELVDRLWNNVFDQNVRDAIGSNSIRLYYLFVKQDDSIAVTKLNRLLDTLTSMEPSSDMSFTYYGLSIMFEFQLKAQSNSQGSKKGTKHGKTVKFLEVSDPLLQFCSSVIFSNSLSGMWFEVASLIFKGVFGIADRPEILVSSWTRECIKQAFGNGLQRMSVFKVSKALFMIGNAAIHLIGHLQKVEKLCKEIESNGQSAHPKSATSSSSPGDTIDDVVGNSEDAIGDTLLSIRYEQLLNGQSSLLRLGLQLVQIVLRVPDINTFVRRQAIFALGNLMLLSPQCCYQKIKVLCSTALQSQDDVSQINTVLLLGDLYVCHSNIMHDNVDWLFTFLTNGGRRVKQNVLMVLTNLVSKGLLKSKNHLSQIAMCLQEEDQIVRDLAKVFFSSLAEKDNAVYNNLSDIIGILSSQDQNLEMPKFQELMKYLFTFLDKERQYENIIERICQKGTLCQDQIQLMKLTFCLTLLPYNTERQFKKFADGINSMADKMQSSQSKKHVSIVLQKCRRNISAVYQSQIDDLERRLNEVLLKNEQDSETAGNAVLAVDFTKISTAHMVDPSVALQKLSLSPTKTDVLQNDATLEITVNQKSIKKSRMKQPVPVSSIISDENVPNRSTRSATRRTAK
ncbi:hypothetical protein MIR68_007788 [Amoeboaphelidium protococcarum]|nr:hypothetical protein MIR68_007788 [Amoeboaphelidium protococcarum]